MLYITTNKIKHSTVGSSFTVSFSVAPDEVWYLQKLYDSFHTMNMCGIPLTLHKTDYYVAKVEDEPQTDCGWK